jgi:hypothetical protein
VGLLGKLRREDSYRTEVWKWEAEHRAYLEKAAGIGRVDLRCHRDTWTHFLDEFERTKNQRDSDAFRPPDPVNVKDEGDGMLLVPLSGNTLAALLERCRRMHAEFPYSALDKAIGRRVRSAIVQALAEVLPPRGRSGPVAVIVLDDRPAAAGEAQTPPPSTT